MSRAFAARLALLLLACSLGWTAESCDSASRAAASSVIFGSERRTATMEVQTDSAFYRLWSKKFPLLTEFAAEIDYSPGHVSEVTAGKMGTSRRFVRAVAKAVREKDETIEDATVRVEKALRLTRAAA